MQVKSDFSAHLLMLLCIFLVAGSFPIGEAITDALPPEVMMCLRFLLAALLFVPVILLRSGFGRLNLHQLLRYSLLSIPLVVFFWCMFEALRYTSAINTGAIYTIVPALTAFTALLINGERSQRAVIIGLQLGILGALWIVFRGDFDALLNLELNYGDGIFLIGCLFMSLHGPLIKQFHLSEPMELMTFWLLLLGGGWLLLLSLISGAEIEWHHINQQVALGLAYLTFFTTLLSFFLLNYCIVKLGATKTSAYSLLTPLCVIPLSLLFGEAEFEPVVIPGAILVLIAMLLIQISEKKSSV